MLLAGKRLPAEGSFRRQGRSGETPASGLAALLFFGFVVAVGETEHDDLAIQIKVRIGGLQRNRLRPGNKIMVPGGRNLS